MPGAHLQLQHERRRVRSDFGVAALEHLDSASKSWGGALRWRMAVDDAGHGMICAAFTFTEPSCRSKIVVLTVMTPVS